MRGVVNGRRIGMDELVTRSRSHPLGPEKLAASLRVREAYLNLAQLLDEVCPAGREKDRAMDAMDDVLFNANAAIARRS